MKSFIEELLAGGYTVDLSNGGGQIKVRTSDGQVVTAFKLADGEREARRRVEAALVRRSA